MKTVMRLDKLLAHCGFGSRSDTKKLLKSGIVTVDGKRVKDGGMQIDVAASLVKVNQDIVCYRQHMYLMLNKPPGVVSATEDSRDRTVVDLLSAQYRHFDLFPVGRLDKDTEGLLLLTNDGKLAHELLSPKKHVPKTYVAHVTGQVSERVAELFKQGVELDDGYRTLPAKLCIKPPISEQLSHIELTIMEGKFHQVKRMFEAVHHRVTFLKRISMGSLLLDPDLKPGDYRELTPEELAQLKGSEEA